MATSILTGWRSCRPASQRAERLRPGMSWFRTSMTRTTSRALAPPSSNLRPTSMLRRQGRQQCFSRLRGSWPHHRPRRAEAWVCVGRQCPDVGRRNPIGLPVGFGPILTLTDSTLLDSPWDLAIDDDFDRATVYVSNVVSGTVTRLSLAISTGKVIVSNKVRIASGHTVQLNPAALILGPTGLAHDQLKDNLYVASTADNAILRFRS
jgi:hypothetical protein